VRKFCNYLFSRRIIINANRTAVSSNGESVKKVLEKAKLAAKMIKKIDEKSARRNEKHIFKVRKNRFSGSGHKCFFYLT
jgi:hypothetical protein